jgi:hypothetical protein
VELAEQRLDLPAHPPLRVRESARDVGRNPVTERQRAGDGADGL